MSKAESRSLKKQNNQIPTTQSHNISSSSKSGQPYISKYYGNLVKNGKVLLSNNNISTTKLIAFSNQTTTFAKNTINKIYNSNNKQLIQSRPFTTTTPKPTRNIPNINESSSNSSNISRSILKNEKSKVKNQNLNYLLSGSIAGAISRSATAGFERLTIIQQVQGMMINDVNQRYIGCIAAIKQMLKKEGFLSWFKGNGANIVKVSPNSGIRFLTYEFCKKQFLQDPDTEKLSVPQTLASGAFAGLTSTFFTYPLDVVRVRLSLQGSSSHEMAATRYKGILHGFTKIHAEEGIRGLYKGLGTAIMSVAPWVSISFASYEGLKKLATTQTFYDHFYGKDSSLSKELNDSEKLNLKQQQLEIKSNSKGKDMIIDFICGALSGAVTMTICYPLDVLRRRMMVQGIGGSGQVIYKNGLQAFKKIFKTEGVGAFYQGIIPAYFKVVPTVAISFAVYELCKGSIGGQQHHSTENNNTNNINNNKNNNSDENDY